MGIIKAQRAADFQYVCAVKCNKFRHYHLFFSTVHQKTLSMLFSSCECFRIFLNLCIAVQLGCAHEDILPALGKIQDKQRSDIQMARGRERSNRLAASSVH